MDDKELIRETHRKNARTFDFEPIIQVELDDKKWRKNREALDIAGKENEVVQLIRELANPEYTLKAKRYTSVIRKYIHAHGLPWFSKSQILIAYHQLVESGHIEHDPEIVIRLQKKPTRSQAGVTVVTVLTKPFPCPGKCIFCPTDVRMPKSYLYDEPGAQRAERHNFDPYEQTASRIQALTEIGHPTDKIELLILGGTWSSYPRDYQEWFIMRCFDAMNGVDSKTLAEAQAINTTTQHRNVGLVVETRQDHIDPDELRWMRQLGVTKVQVGIQSMDEHVLAINKRGHDAQATRDAFRLLRLGGFKIHGHWMANLLGATPESDVADYKSLWSDPAIQPDELKIYPCMLVKNADLYAYWKRGEYKPYTEDQLTDILVECLAHTPRYNRLTRVIRDIPTTNVVEGNKKANLRQIAALRLEKAGRTCHDIRSREIRRDKVSWEDLKLVTTTYETDATTEHFLSYETDDERIAGFLRLSLPHRDQALPLPELENHAMIREVHVYGPALNLGNSSTGEAQHMGLGGRLIDKAKAMSKAAGYTDIAVISAIGTQGYYARHNFAVNGLYMTTTL